MGISNSSNPVGPDDPNNLDSSDEDLLPSASSLSELSEITDSHVIPLGEEAEDKVQLELRENAIKVMAVRIATAMAYATPESENLVAGMRKSLEEIGCDLEKLDFAVKEHEAIEEAATKLVEVMNPTTPAEEKEMQDVLARIKEDGLDVGKIKKAIKRVSVRLHPDK